MNRQPTLEGDRIRLRPLLENDFESLYKVASDPLIWEQHPESTRYKREIFKKFFDSGIDSQGAFVVLDRTSGEIIGSSRYNTVEGQNSSIEIGHTFLSRRYWGGGFNRELKNLMLGYAFRFVDEVYFFVGEKNFRSQKAMEKIGGIEVRRETRKQLHGNTITSVVYLIEKERYAHIDSSKS